MKNQEEIEDYFMLCSYARDAKGFPRNLLEQEAIKIGIHNGTVYKNKALLLQAIQNKWRKHFQENIAYYEVNFKDTNLLRHLKTKIYIFSFA